MASLEKRRSLEDVEDIDLCDLLGKIKQDFQVECVGKELGIELGCETGIVVRGERFLLRQAVSNLLQNAIDFSPQGGEVSLECRAAGRAIEINVVDQGEGIPDYAWDRIFERFYSLPRPGGAQKSTGLGLNLVREAVELHGGSVSIERVGAATRAQIRLPL